MNQPDDKVIQQLEAIDAVLSASPVNLVALKAALVSLLTHLSSPQGRTDENCCAVDIHFCLDENWPVLNLPPDFHDLLADLGGALHDTVSDPEIAKNFESTPEQLLARGKKLNTEPPG